MTRSEIQVDERHNQFEKIVKTQLLFFIFKKIMLFYFFIIKNIS
jgi:hypothetical protein